MNKICYYIKNKCIFYCFQLVKKVNFSENYLSVFLIYSGLSQRSKQGSYELWLFLRLRFVVVNFIKICFRLKFLAYYKQAIRLLLFLLIFLIDNLSKPQIRKKYYARSKIILRQIEFQNIRFDFDISQINLHSEKVYFMIGQLLVYRWGIMRVFKEKPAFSKSIHMTLELIESVHEAYIEDKVDYPEGSFFFDPLKKKILVGVDILQLSKSRIAKRLIYSCITEEDLEYEFERKLAIAKRYPYFDDEWLFLRQWSHFPVDVEGALCIAHLQIRFYVDRAFNKNSAYNIDIHMYLDEFIALLRRVFFSQPIPFQPELAYYKIIRSLKQQN